MDVAQPLLEPDHGLAVAGEAEMAGLDDPGMDRPDRDLVQALRRSRAGTDMGAAPPSRLSGQTPWSSQGRWSGAPVADQTVEVMDRALEP